MSICLKELIFNFELERSGYISRGWNIRESLFLCNLDFITVHFILLLIHIVWEREGGRGMRKEGERSRHYENYLNWIIVKAHIRNHMIIVFWLRTTSCFRSWACYNLCSSPQFSHLKNCYTCLLGLFWRLNEIFHKALRIVPSTSWYFSKHKIYLLH